MSLPELLDEWRDTIRELDRTLPDNEAGRTAIKVEKSVLRSVISQVERAVTAAAAAQPALPAPAAGVDPRSIEYRVHAHAFNALTRAVPEDMFITLSDRQALADAVVAAIEPIIRADEREAAAQPASGEVVEQLRADIMAPGGLEFVRADIHDTLLDAVLKNADEDLNGFDGTREQEAEHYVRWLESERARLVEMLDNPAPAPAAAPGEFPAAQAALARVLSWFRANGAYRKAEVTRAQLAHAYQDGGLEVPEELRRFL